MTTIRVSLVDAYLLRVHAGQLETLLLRRAAGGRCPGSWEAVHGHIEPGEEPAQAADREIAEETGVRPDQLYNLSRVETFYQHRLDELAMVPVFVGMVAGSAQVVLGPEHDDFVWLTIDEARTRFSWPREGRAIADAVRLLAGGDAGPLEDVLRVR